MRFKNVFLILIQILCLASCSYHWGDIERKLPGGYKLVSIPIFSNKTHESGIEIYFTNAIIREFNRSNIAKITSKENANVLLEGVIESISYISGSQITGGAPRRLPSEAVLTTEYRILINTFVQLRRISDKQVIWSGRFQGERSYSAPQVESPGVNSVNPLYNHSAHHQHIALMAQDSMNEAFAQMTENF